MKKIMLLLTAVLVVACSPKKEVVDLFQGVPGADGQDGSDGVSCSAMQSEGGLILSCGNGDFFVSNGMNGADGADGADGQDGVNGSDGEDGQDGAEGPQGPAGEAASGLLSEIVLNSCTLVQSGLYAKLVGSGSLKLYSNGLCIGNSVESLSSEDELYVLSGGNMLIFQSTNNKLYKLTLN